MSQRRSVRKQVVESLQAIDAITGTPLARIGNLSADGMMLISTRPLPERHVYQVRFPLSGPHGRTHRIEVGIQCLWSDSTSSDNSHWTGCQIISVSPSDQDALDAWVEQADATG